MHQAGLAEQQFSQQRALEEGDGGHRAPPERVHQLEQLGDERGALISQPPAVKAQRLQEFHWHTAGRGRLERGQQRRGNPVGQRHLDHPGPIQRGTKRLVHRFPGCGRGARHRHQEVGLRLPSSGICRHGLWRVGVGGRVSPDGWRARVRCSMGPAADWQTAISFARGRPINVEVDFGVQLAAKVSPSTDFSSPHRVKPRLWSCPIRFFFSLSYCSLRTYRMFFDGTPVPVSALHQIASDLPLDSMMSGSRLPIRRQSPATGPTFTARGGSARYMDRFSDWPRPPST